MVGWDSKKLFWQKQTSHWLPDLLWLGGIWLVISLCDRLWITLDQAPPAWDAADYMAGSLGYWKALQTPDWFSGQWWTNLWLLSSKIPPFVYISAAPFISWFGNRPDDLLLLFLVYSVILLVAVYALGRYLFNRQVGLWAAALCGLMPTCYQARLDYLLDYPLAAMVTLAFLGLTLWWGTTELTLPPESGTALPLSPSAPQPPAPFDRRQPATWVPVAWAWLQWHWVDYRAWVWAIAAGVALGLSLLTKQPAGLFLLFSLVFCAGQVLWQRRWRRVGQFLLLLLASVPVWYPWYRTNWLLILTSSKRATVDSAAIQGSPALLSLDSLTFYLRYLPWMVSLPLLLVPLLGLVLFWRRSRVGGRGTVSVDYDLKSADYRQRAYISSRQALIWLLIFLAGSYVTATVNPNKDTRYFLPCLPILAVVLAYGLTLLPRSWRLLHWGSVSLAGVLMLSALFPLFAPVRSSTVPRQLFPYQGAAYPLPEVIRAVRQAEPWLRANIGVLPSTQQVNQHNVNFYGMAQDFQVYGRQVGTLKKAVDKDRGSMEWFLLKTGDQGAIRQTEAQTAIVNSITQGGEFAVQQRWGLPDASELQLYHRRQPQIQVKPLSGKQPPPSTPVQLKTVTVPAAIPPGQPVPVTYTWEGEWQALHQGLMVLTWQRQERATAAGAQRWLHDHAIALGNLYAEQPETTPPAPPGSLTTTTTMQVTERLAMLPPADLVPGTYELTAVYVQRRTGEATTIAVPPVTLQVNPTAAAVPAPELDLLTQLRSLAVTLPKGPQSLERISNEINRINQYDPVQDYLIQVQQAMQYRLTQEPNSVNHAYTLALATVLKRQVNAAIAALQRVTQLDAKNPYAYAYLAFVNLYDFRARAAQEALQSALKLAPNNPEIQALSGIAALMRGQIFRAWSHAQAFQKAQQMRG